MSLVAFVVLALGLAICLAPVSLLRASSRRRAQDYFVASRSTRLEVVRNSSIAYGLRVATFGPFFVWGASGELWPAIVASVCLGLGVYLVYILRRPILDFMDDAIESDRSVTVHELIARAHGNDPRVRLLTSALTLFALGGLLVAEALAVVVVLRPMLPSGAAGVWLLAIGMALLMLLQVIPSGHRGVMHSAQLQLGMLYLGLFGSATILLYLHMSALAPRPLHGTLAIACFAACSATMLGYRSSKYVDTDPIRSAATDLSRTAWIARFVSRFGKIFNIAFSVVLVLVIVFALMALQGEGVARAARESFAALQAGTRVPAITLVALCLMLLLHPICDVTNWQRLAAARAETSSCGVESRRRPATLQRLYGMYSIENALGLLAMCSLGGLAAIAIPTPSAADPLRAFVAHLSSAEKSVSVIASPLLLLFVFAAGLSTMSSLFSAGLWTIRYDTLPALWPELAPGRAQAADETTAMRRTFLAGSGLCLSVAAAFFIAESYLDVSVASSSFLAVVSALCCAQLSLVPLLAAAIIGRKRAAFAPIWALIILAAGASGAAAAVTVYLVTGEGTWLWAAVPACLGCGLLLFFMAPAGSQPALGKPRRELGVAESRAGRPAHGCVREK